MTEYVVEERKRIARKGLQPPPPVLLLREEEKEGRWKGEKAKTRE